jgi:nucleoside-diphosphate-sugar epimerase
MSMRVLVTGAGGNLGRAALPALAEAGHAVRALDFRPIETEHELVVADIRDATAVTEAAAGCDAVVHAAALHGIHLRAWSAQDFWAINAHGSFNVLEAAREHGIARLVLASTMGVYGRSLEPPAGAWAWVHEGLPALPQDVYGMTKLVAEQLARDYSRVHGVTTVALRLGMYVPAGFEHYGFRLLFGGVDERDVAQAVLLGLNHQPDSGFDAFDIMADTPFRPEDALALQREPLAVLERYWPGCTRLFEQRGVEVAEHLWGRFLWPVAKAKEVLGYRPRWGFTEFLDALRAGDPGRYPFLDLPSWGVEGKGPA